MQPIFEKLKELGIEYLEYTHPPVYTVEEAAQYYADVPGGISKNLFLRNKKGNQHYLVVVEGSKNVDIKDLSDKVNDHKLGFASPERLEKYLNVKPGSVSPFGLIFDTEKHIKVIVDEDLLAYDQIHYHPNDNTKTIVIKSSDLIRFITELQYQPTIIKL